MTAEEFVTWVRLKMKELTHLMERVGTISNPLNPMERLGEGELKKAMYTFMADLQEKLEQLSDPYLTEEEIAQHPRIAKLRVGKEPVPRGVLFVAKRLEVTPEDIEWARGVMAEGEDGSS